MGKIQKSFDYHTHTQKCGMFPILWPYIFQWNLSSKKKKKKTFLLLRFSSARPEGMLIKCKTSLNN